MAIKFTEMVPASQIWPTAKDFEDLGEIQGLMRGYNLEVNNGDKIDWMSAEWVYGTPEEAFDDEYHRWSRNEWGLELTGRICFRGYGVERYDEEERDTYIVPVIPFVEPRNQEGKCDVC